MSLSRGWSCRFYVGGVSLNLRHRLRMNYVLGQKGSARRLLPGEPAWFLSGSVKRERVDRWFATAEEGLAWAQERISMAALQDLK